MNFEDFESYPDELGVRRSQSGCIGKLLPLAILAMAVMWVLQQVPSSRSTPPDGQQSDATFPVDPDLPRMPVDRRADSGDWSIEQVETSKPVRSGASDRSKVTSTTEGDWVLEEVETGSSGAPQRQVDVNDPKSTREGDWAIEEVESGKP